ncbi:hypothetical protein PP304_gp143 [Gordonia phage Phendrix]|uniref:Uncharacterized protein n=2 Tax=Godonkavirus TaxID=2733178 RepID=A0A4D6E2A8_9CAUD|nr:hypothetical protein HOV33_gp146 [Gordonia phage GodonK]YP_010649224.1 hypothetical protein PP304_gp143 [Gordonia phage Phendrix]QBZ72810.1 hypothetical protein SEA_GODONK_222 [Gordonia phage GodonK]QDK02726.1 hypothetical protein SEA_PHENDRIX_210 [Gordonia phage Phendrix]
MIHTHDEIRAAAIDLAGKELDASLSEAGVAFKKTAEDFKAVAEALRKAMRRPMTGGIAIDPDAL